MQFSPTTWLLAAYMAAIANAAGYTAGILEVDLVFPRNETYAPTDWFPVVFAFQNAERARYLNLHIEYTIRKPADPWNGRVSRSHDLRWTNWSSHDPYFVYAFSGSFATEGHWMLAWHLSWQSCNEEAFTKVDLVAAATANDTCPPEQGVAINVTDKTMHVPSWAEHWSGGDHTGDICAVVASSSPTPTPDPCRVDIDSAIVASMSASLTATLCRGLNPPPDCPKDDDNAAQKLAVFGVSCLLAAFGAFGFFLM
jgi:hypothetical protein